MKKILSLLVVMALLVSSFAGSAFAATGTEIEVGDVIAVTDLSELPEGTYELESDLSCFITAMGGVEFGAGLYDGATLIIDEDGNASMVLNFGTNPVTIYTISTEAFVSETYFYGGDKTSVFGIQNAADEWVDATSYTLSEEASVVGNSSAGKVNSKYVTTMTLPLDEVAAEYALALGINSNTMGMQFGGEGATYAATLSVDWTNVTVKELVEPDPNKISVTALDELAPGEYELKSDLSCFITAMGGVEFGAGLYEGATLIVDEDGNVSMILNFGTNPLTIYTISTEAFVSETYFYGGDKTSVFGIQNAADEWVNATSYTLSEEASVVGNSSAGGVNSKYVTTLTLPLDEVAAEYALALGINSNTMGMQFGGEGANYAATLSVDWSKVTIIELYDTEEDLDIDDDLDIDEDLDIDDDLEVEEDLEDEKDNTNTEIPKTGDNSALMISVVAMIVAAAGIVCTKKKFNK